MAKLITDTGRKAIKKMAEVNHLVTALKLMPTAEDFAMMLIGDMKRIAKMMSNISTRMDEIMDKYTSIPTEFLLKGFDVILQKLNDANDYAKFAIKETTDVMSSTVKSAQELKNAVGNAVSATTSAALQIGGGIACATEAMSANIKLAMEGNGRRVMTNDVANDVTNGEVPFDGVKQEFESRIEESVGKMDDTANYIRDWTENAATKSTETIDEFFGNIGEGIDSANEWIDGKKNAADAVVDDTIGVLIEKVENAKAEVEEKINRVKEEFENLTKQFDKAFGFVNGKNFAEETFRDMSNTAVEKMDSPVFDAVGEMTGEIADFIKNFNIGKVVGAIGGLTVGAGVATLAMDLLPSIDIDKMLKEIVGGIETAIVDKMTELYIDKYSDGVDLLDVPGVPWRLSKDDLEKYNADGYEKYLEEFREENDNKRSEILLQMQNVKSAADLDAVTEANREKMKENKSAIKAMRKVRRDAIKAKQIEKYKGFLKIELEYLKKELNSVGYHIKTEWDTMMAQYKKAAYDIAEFFTKEGKGGNESIDRCCDRINDDADQIVELCQSITVELTNTVAMVPTPYAIGSCVDMPVHKILAFFKDVKIIVTFLKNLIRLGIDIISQITILAKIVAGGLKGLADIFKLLKDIIGVDTILNMIDYLVALFRPKMIDAKMLIENAISPIYYNETEDYEMRVAAIEALLDDEKEEGGKIKTFRYTDDKHGKKYNDEFGGKTKDDGKLEEWLEELEAKGEREVVAYRSPILNEAGDDFAGWIFYYADAYDNMDTSWGKRKKRRRNKLIKKASRKNKLAVGKLIGGVAQLKKNMSFGYYENGKFIKNSVNGFDAYYWYTKWTNDPTDCEPDMSNGYTGGSVEKNVVSPVTTTSNGSLVELSDGRRVFVEGKIVKSGDYVNVNGVKYRVK